MTETTISHCGDIRIVAPAVVREVVTHNTCRAALPNGKLVFGFTERPEVHLSEGDHVKLILSLCDFSRGEIM